jgi:hypothetical protein
MNTRREIVRIVDETEGQRMRRLQGKKKRKGWELELELELKIVWGAWELKRNWGRLVLKQ